MLCTFLSAIASCKKENQDITYKSRETDTNFFEIQKDINPITLKIVNEIKDRNKSDEFVNEFSLYSGFPVWNKSLIKISQNKDTIVYTPLVLNKSKYTNGFIKSVINKNISISSHLRSEYKNYSFSETNSFSANDYVTMFAYFDNMIFNHSRFTLTDLRLFKEIPSRLLQTGNRVLKINNISSDSPSIKLWTLYSSGGVVRARPRQLHL